MSLLSRVAALALAVCLLAVAVIVLWPSHPSIPGLNQAVDRVLDPLVHDGLPSVVLRPGAFDFASNIVMFFPLGFLGTLALPRRLWWVAPVACLFLSSAIETTQLLFLPGRTFAPRDVASNTIGGLAGTAVAAALRRGVYALGRRRSAAV